MHNHGNEMRGGPLQQIEEERNSTERDKGFTKPRNDARLLAEPGRWRYFLFEQSKGNHRWSKRHKQKQERRRVLRNVKKRKNRKRDGRLPGPGRRIAIDIDGAGNKEKQSGSPRHP